MYLASLYVVLDLDPEVLPQERERVLSSLREKLKQKFTHRVTLRIDEHESSIALAFFDDNFERIKKRVEEILDRIDNAGEARIRFHQEQFFCWFDGKFTESSDNLTFTFPSVTDFNSQKRLSNSLRTNGKTIVYTDNEDDMTSLPTRFSRRNIRIPTRK